MQGAGDSEHSGDEGESDSRTLKAVRREEFKQFLKFLAAESDVEIVPHKVVTGSRAFHLCSENRSEIPEGFSFTTTKSLVEMFDEWCSEMKSRDGDAGSFGVKLKSIFAIHTQTSLISFIDFSCGGRKSPH